jgi:hypothetical protein
MAVRQDKRAEGGISESIGFILIFSIVMAGIGLVTLYGYPMLMAQQSNANERIMEKNMIVLQNDLKSIAYKTVPYKESSLRVEGGSLTVYNTQSSPVISKIDINDCTGNPPYYVSAFQSGDLRYSSDSAATDISLQNGAVVTRRHYDPGSTMLAEPRWFYDNQTNSMVINLIGFNSTNILSRAGIGTVEMAMGGTNYTYISPAPSPLCIVYTPDPTPAPNGQDYSVAWDNYFMKILNNPPDITVLRTGTPGNGGPLTYRLTVSSPVSNPLKLVIKKYDVVVKSL